MADRDPTSKTTNWLRRSMLLLAVGLIGHLYYWYWPRARSSEPDPSSQVAALVLGDEGPEVRMWIPFPHQNLATLERRMGDLGSALQNLQALLGSPSRVELPSFGPYRVPPATEMAIATDLEGQKLVVTAEVYPLATWLFRAAGTLAGNPWMAGGVVDQGARRIRIEWRRNRWTASTGRVDFAAPQGGLKTDSSLLLVRLGSIPGPITGGLYRLIETESGPAITSNLTGPAHLPPGVDHLRRQKVAFSWTETAVAGGVRSIESLVAWPGGQSQASDLPPLLIAARPPVDSRPLPGQQVLEAVGVKVLTRSLDSWSLKSFDSASLQAADRLVAGLNAFAEAEGQLDGVQVGYLDIDEAFKVARRVGQTIQQVPIVGEEEARRWLAFARLLEDPKGFSWILVWRAESGGLEVRFGTDPTD